MFSMKVKVTLALGLLFLFFAGFAHAEIKDSDSDGLSDESETGLYRTDPLKFDTDQDSFSDGVEALNGTDPLNKISSPSEEAKKEGRKILPDNPPIYWYISRIAGIVSFILFTFVVTFGLVMTSKIVLKFVKVAKLNTVEIHRTLAWAAFLMLFLHIGSLFLDDYVKLTLPELILPGKFQRSLYSGLGVNISVPVGLGISAFYLIICLIVTSELRNKIINIKFWRSIHYLSFLTYVLFLVHGFLAGTDSDELWMRLIYTASACWVVVWVSLRIFRKDLFYPKPKKLIPKPLTPVTTVPSAQVNANITHVEGIK
ncbi:MAG: ferric reductase-like transmembrane domain-containing protein [Patescibacteria group bacterium]